MTDPITRTLEVPGAVLTYDVREPATPTTEPTRGALALAERLGVEPVTFPGGHNGFLGGVRPDRRARGVRPHAA